MHGGPFANIAHGCNSVMATKTALKLADYVVTEAGFGADLGAEKFFDIKCRKAGLQPDAVVLVATTKALKMHGGVPKRTLARKTSSRRQAAARTWAPYPQLGKFGVPVTVAINHFTRYGRGTSGIRILLRRFDVSAPCPHIGTTAAKARPTGRDSCRLIDSSKPNFAPLYDDDAAVGQGRHIADDLRRRDIIADKKVREQFDEFEEAGYGHYPICMAKTQYSFSTDPQLLVRRTGTSPDPGMRLATGAEFLVRDCGAIMTMPGLPRVPASENIDVNEDGDITGLF